MAIELSFHYLFNILIFLCPLSMYFYTLPEYDTSIKFDTTSFPKESLTTLGLENTKWCNRFNQVLA